MSPSSKATSIIDGDVEKGSKTKGGLGVSAKDVRAAAVSHDVFVAEEGGEGPDFRGVGSAGATVLLLKTQFGLGVLSLPSVMNTVGLVPGLLLIIVLGILTTYGDYVLGQFALEYPGIHSVSDIGYIMGGVVGREIFAASYAIFMIFIVSAGILACSIALNAITSHATCTVAFSVCGAFIIGIGASPRTLKQISWLGWVGVCFILPAIFIVVIAVGVIDRPADAPPTGDFDKQLKAFNGDASFSAAMLSVVNVLFAYGGTPAFLSVISEMREPRKFSRSMLTAQTTCILLYVCISVVVWFYTGQYVASPALGSAGPTIKKIAYGIAIPGLVAGPIIVTHSTAKFIFVRLLRGTKHLQSSTPTHWITWLSTVVGITAIGFIIAEVIPFFNELIGLIGAVFASMYCITLWGVVWIWQHDHKRKEGPTSLRYKLLYANAVMMVVLGLFILVGGLYGAIKSIKDLFESGGNGKPFSCSDNSNSV